MSVQKNSQTRKQQMQEIEYQKKMLSNLKKWMRNLIVLSSVGIVIAYWAMHLMNGWILRNSTNQTLRSNSDTKREGRRSFPFFSFT